MVDIMGLMKQAGAMQAKMAEMQAEMDNITVEGGSGGGLVKVTMTAKGALKGVSVDASLLKPEEKEILEDLLIAAHEDGRRKAEALMEEKMKAMTAGLKLPPGMKLPF
jgi:DNA-binding YbaB/EbfC family protein